MRTTKSKIKPRIGKIPEAAEGSTRTILTVYCDDEDNILKKNYSTYPNNAVKNCVDHMQTNHYGASVAEVYDCVTGEVHAVVVFTMKGMEIILEREPDPYRKP